MIWAFAGGLLVGVLGTLAVIGGLIGAVEADAQARLGTEGWGE